MSSLKIGQLRPGMKNVCVNQMILLEKGPVMQTKDGHSISHCLVADDTACLKLSLWDSHISELSGGDILKLTNGYCTLYKSVMTLYVGKTGKLQRTGEFTMLFTETPNLSSMQYVTDPNHPKLMMPAPSHAATASSSANTTTSAGHASSSTSGSLSHARPPAPLPES